MISDSNLICSDAQAFTATAICTTPYDMGDALGVMGSGENVGFKVTVATAFTGLTSLQVQLVAGDESDLSDYNVIAQTEAIALADLPDAGELLFNGNAVPLTEDAYQYWGFRYVVVGTGTAGAVNAEFCIDQSSQHAYAKSYSQLV